MSLLRRLPFAFLLAVVLPLSLAAQPANAPSIPLAELKPGQKGEVWTVFKGDEPEPFAVEVTGVLQNALGPGKNLILCELTDPRVQNMGAVAGMSGSPLYIGGRLAGVLSYQIQRFETVHYAGFTPIADMLEISSLPSALAAPPDSGVLPIRGARDNRNTSVSGASAGVAGDMRPLSPVFTVSGISPRVAALFEPQFQALGLGAFALGGSSDSSNPAQAAAPSAATELKPGDVVAAALAVGDISIAATGTVSHVDGKRVLAFGHPMLALGATELPMTAAEVVTILPSQFSSVKVSNTGEVIGSFSQDRLSGVYGEIGRTPRMVPVDIDLPGRLNRKALHFSVVRQEQILPVIVASGLAQAVSGSNEAGFTRGFRLTTTVDFPGAAPLTFNKLYPGPQGFQQGVSELVANLQQCLFNPYEHIYPEHIKFSVEETPEVPVGYVELIRVSRTRADPGSSVTVTVNWHGFQQNAVTETYNIPVSADWAGKDLEIVLAPGPTLDDLTGRAKLVVPSDYRDFAEYLDAFRFRRETDGLYLAVVERTRMFSDQRSLTPEMPGSFERIARTADGNRFQQRNAAAPLWETHLLPGRLFATQVSRPLQVTD